MSQKVNDRDAAYHASQIISEYQIITNAIVSIAFSINKIAHLWSINKKVKQIIEYKNQRIIYKTICYTGCQRFSMILENLNIFNLQ